LEKPVSLVGDAIDDSTVPGQIVLDPFVGRGTTLIAAEKTDRICYGMEICPRKMDAALRRWQKLTGVNAIRSSSKRTLNP
jgi:DNA modification methylase